MIIEVKIQDNVLEYDIPFSCREIKFQQFCRFKEYETMYFEAVRNDLPVDEIVELQMLMIGCLVKGDLEAIPYGGDLSALLKIEFQIGMGADFTLTSVYAHLVVLINSYKPESVPDVLKIKHRKHTFVVKRIPVARLMNGRGLTTGESLELMEYQRRATKAMKAGAKGIANIEFSLGLSQMAILVRKKGERLPSSKGERDAFINERREVFKDMTLDVIFDCRYFFSAALLTFRKNRSTGFSSKVHRGPKRRARVMRKRKGKRVGK